MLGETVSAHWPSLVCAQIQSGGSAAVRKASNKLGRQAGPSYLSILRVRSVVVIADVLIDLPLVASTSKFLLSERRIL